MINIKYVRLVLLVILSVVSTALAYKLVLFASENYFFDKLIYKKNPAYGYTKGVFPNYPDSDKAILARVKDLAELSQKSSVLGVSNSQYKIVVIGDSFAYGIGVKNGNRFATILEKKLNKLRPTRVYTLALPGDDFLNYYDHYNLAMQRLDPDLVIITMVDNDFIVNPTLSEEQKHFIESVKNICGNNIKYLNWKESYNLWKNFLSEEVLPAADEGYSNSCLFKNVLKGIDMTRTIFIPMNEVPDEQPTAPANLLNEEQMLDYKYKSMMYKFKTMINDERGTVLKINYSVIPDRKLRVSQTEGHFSKYTNQFIADILFSEITSNQKWKFSGL